MAAAAALVRSVSGRATMSLRVKVLIGIALVGILAGAGGALAFG